MTPHYPKKIFLLDAMALIYRSYFAFSNNHRYNSAGLCTSAMFGYTNTLLEVLNKEKPTHLVVVTDTAAPTARHEEFTEYKAHRDEMPDDLVKSLPYIRKITEAFNIPFIGIDGYEADDVIGTLAKQGEKLGYKVFMMTPDKDFGQLVSANISIYKPARMGNGAEILGPAEVCKRFEITYPEQVIDILGLMGDSADNIPGIPGVGEKTAISLIKEYGSIENLYKDTSALKGKLKEKVDQNRHLAELSRKLATIWTDAPCTFNEESFLVKEVNKEEISQLFEELEFRALAKRILTTAEPGLNNNVAANVPTDLFGNPLTTTKQDKNQLLEEGDEELPSNKKTIKEVDHHYLLVQTPEEINALVKELNGCTSFCFDTETTHTNALMAEIVGMSFAYQPHKAYYVPFPDEKAAATAQIEWFRPLLENANITKIGQNIKYDMAILANYGVKLKGPLFDTMLAHYLLQPDLRHGMDVMAEDHLNYTPISIETLIGKKGKAQLNMRQVPLPLIKEYAAEDADITLQLKEIFDPLLDTAQARDLFNKIETPLISVLEKMEREGATINVNALQEISQELEIELKKAEEEITSLAGTTFNLNSPKQLGDVLFEVLKIDEKAKKTKTGQYATNEETLSKLINKHPIISRILDYREFQKLKSTYVDALPELINPNTGKIHTSYNQAVAATGRLSSNNPNLQNIPIRTDRGKEIRKAFVPRSPEFTLLSADYSQIELRIIAELSGEENMIQAFVNREDIHSATASNVWGVPLAEVDADMRRKAKVVNFGIIYGISAFGLSERIGISRTESKELIEQYFRKFPKIKEYMDSSILFARENGYVETIMKRRRYVKDINTANAVSRGFAERNAINAPIQGSAADMIKIAMINIHQEMEERALLSRMILQVHDELVFDCHLSEKEILKELVKRNMENAVKLNVPIEAETGFGNNWLEAH